MATPVQLDLLLAQMQAMVLRQAALEARLQAAQAQPQAPARRVRRAVVDAKGLGAPPQLEADDETSATFPVQDRELHGAHVPRSQRALG